MSDDARRRGGQVRAERLSQERRIEIARMGGLARSGDDGLPRALDEGVLKINGAEIPCAVLENKQRVLTQSGVMKALGRARQAKGRQYYTGDVNLPAFLTAQNLKPFIPNELYVTSSQIEFRRKTGGKVFSIYGGGNGSVRAMCGCLCITVSPVDIVADFPRHGGAVLVLPTSERHIMNTPKPG